jgi:hypothetical protein
MSKRIGVLTTVLVQIVALALWGVAQAGPLQPLQTFTGGVAFSADGVGGTLPNGTPILGGNLRVQTTVDASTVLKAWLYNVTFNGDTRSVGLSPATTQANLGGILVTLNRLGGTDPTCCTLQTYRADVTGIVAPLIGLGRGITSIPVSLPSLISTNPQSDGLALVVVYSSPNLPGKQSVSILDGGQGGPALQNTFFALSGPLDKTVAEFKAILSLGIQFSSQAPGDGHGCGGHQFSQVDVNGGRLTTCAGNRDDGSPGGNGDNGTLITIGGVGDDTLNPPDPFGPGGNDDELYGISSFLKQGDLLVNLTTSNPSNDDSIFIAILELTADICSVGINSSQQLSCDHQVPAPSALLLLSSGLMGVLGAGWFLRR